MSLKNVLIKTIIMSGVFLISGCVSIPKYKQPVDSNTASVRFLHTNPDAYFAIVSTFDGMSCAHKTNIGWLGGDSTVDTVRIGMLDSTPPSNATIERRVVAGQLLVAGPRQVIPSASVGDVLFALTPGKQQEIRGRFVGMCRLPSFTPQAGKEYEVVMNFAPGKCSIIPYQLVRKPDGGTARQRVADTKPTSVIIKQLELECDNHLH